MTVQKEVFLEGKRVVITSGASGIGRALAEQLAELGAQVTVLDIIRATDLPDSVTAIQADVTDLRGLKACASMGLIDLLIIGAGVTSKNNEPTEKEIELMRAVNAYGVSNTLEAFDSHLTKGAQIVYLGSHKPAKADYRANKSNDNRERKSTHQKRTSRKRIHGLRMWAMARQGNIVNPAIYETLGAKTIEFTPLLDGLVGAWTIT